MYFSELKTDKYQLIIKGFEQWLSSLGYSKTTIYNSPRQAYEFLHWLEQQGIIKIEAVTKHHFKEFIEHFKARSNKVTGEGLSVSYVNKQIATLNKFNEYLKQNKYVNFLLHLKQFTQESVRPPIVLSKSEIKELYEATEDDLIGIRDRAMLSVYYGCGLRKSEGLFLEVSDVLFDKKQLYIRKAKNGYERYVPIPIRGLQDLERYIYTARPLLLDENQKTKQLFISERGNPLHSESVFMRLKALRLKTAPPLRDKTFGLHALRHSIATHLLQAGMELENIALFLGHKTLDSTQIYTHIVNELSHE